MKSRTLACLILAPLLAAGCASGPRPLLRGGMFPSSYQPPPGHNSIKDAGLKYGQASRDYRFAAGVALFGMLLRDSPYKGTASWDAAIELAQEGVGSDLEGYRIELVDLIKTAKQLAGK